MTKRILTISVLAALLMGAPVMASAHRAIEVIENEIPTVTISISESVLHVTGANGEMLYIYNVAGVRVMSMKVEGADRRIELNLPKGCYIVKVGNTVRKISIK